MITLVCFWSEREGSLRACADAVLHKPPRQAHWEAVLDRLGVRRFGRSCGRCDAAVV